MLHDTPRTFVASLPQQGPLMGMDMGSKTIGLAVSDGAWVLASPLGSIRRTKFAKDAQVLLQWCRRYEVAGLVVGLPLQMDGNEGTRCQSVRDTVRNLQQVEGLHDYPIFLHDERLSSVAVERVLIEDADMTRKRRGAVIDKMAAAWILQGFLDQCRAGGRVGGLP